MPDKPVNPIPAVEEALASLDIWIEMGEEMAPALTTRRDQLVLTLESAQRELARIDIALRMIHGEPQKRTVITIRDPEKAARVRRSIKRVLGGAQDGLAAAEIAVAVIAFDQSFDRYDIHNALPGLVKRNAITKSGARNKYIYSLPPGTVVE